MDEKVFWEVFRDTGDPTAWLLYRAAKQKGDKDKGLVSSD